MLDQCQTCGRKIDWRRQAIGHCNCGASFSTARTEPASIEVSNLSAAIAELEANGACNAVPGSDLDGLLAAAWFFGDVAHAHGRRNPGTAKPAIHLLRSKIQAAAPVLLDWPNGLRDWLIAHRGDRPVQASMHSMFGNLLEALRVGLRGRAAFLVDQIGSILAEEWYDGAVKWNSYYYKTSHGTRWLTLKETARHIGVRAETIGRMVECGELKGKVLPAGRRRFYWFDAEGLGHAERLFKRRLTLTQASKYLGVPTHTLRELAGAGLIPALSRCDHNAPHYFDRQALEAFVKNLWHRATLNANEHKVISLPNVAARASSVCEVLKHINTGQIMAVRMAKNMTTATGLRLIGVREKDLDQVRGDGGGHIRYTLREAANELGVPPRMIQVAVRHGLLTLTRPDQPHAKRNISSEALDEFRQKYKMLRTVTHRLGTNSRHAMSLMRRAGYRPVIEADCSLGISSIWRAEDVIEFLAVAKRAQS